LRIERHDLEKRGAFYLTMLHYFDAPQVIYLCIDKSLSWISIFDCGCFVQNLCLLAVSKGLGTCIQQSGVHFPDIIRRYVPIPEEKKILLNISIGYPDDEAPVNQFRSHRDSPEDFIISEMD
ncbi:MAG: nitroreductase, partial [Pseudomonadota bacterium]